MVHVKNNETVSKFVKSYAEQTAHHSHLHLSLLSQHTEDSTTQTTHRLADTSSSLSTDSDGAVLLSVRCGG